MGSLSFETSICMRWSRIMKLVADVSSSMSRTLAPISRDSMMFAAWEVLPLASSDEKSLVSCLKGRFFMKGEISTFSILLPSSARIFTAVGSDTTSSLPSPGMWLYTPSSSADSRVDFP